MKTLLHILPGMLLIALLSCNEETPVNEHGRHASGNDTNADMSGMHGMDHGNMDHGNMDHGNMDHGNMDHGTADHSNMLVLTAREQLLAGITIDSIRHNQMGNSISALGIVDADDQNKQIISTRVPGRIQKLYVRNSGSEIERGEPLYDIYSEVLLQEQSEYLQLTGNDADSGLIIAAKNKLLLHGMSENQIRSVAQNKKVMITVTIYSDYSGYVSTLQIREGQTVTAGETMFEIGSLNTVRVNVQLYINELNELTGNEKYTIGNDTLHAANVLFSNPSLQNSGKTYDVYLRVNNPDHALRPGMMVAVNVHLQQENLLSVPRTCVLEEDGMRFIWVLEPDGMFNRRMVTTGKEDESFIEITSGVQQGERIVSNGVYLLNSEFILRKGANSMAGMEM